MLEDLGSDVLELPLIKILPQENKNLLLKLLLESQLTKLGLFSQVQMEFEFLNYFLKHSPTLEVLVLLRIACVGEAQLMRLRNIN